MLRGMSLFHSPRRVSRRSFLYLAALANPSILAAAQSRSRGIGVQLYTVRELLPERASEVLRVLAEIGYSEVEVLGRDLEVLAPILKGVGLNAVSGHFEAPLVTGNWRGWERQRPGLPYADGWKAAVETASAHGLRFMVVAYLMPEERGDLDFYRRFADQMNRAGELARSADIQLCYHNHAFEFQPMGGTTPLKVLMERFDRQTVGLELDVFWASIAGRNPVLVMREFRGRVWLLHLKDRPAGIPQTFSEGDVPETAFREVGYGILDFRRILATAQRYGTQHFFVEQDHCGGDPLESLRASFDSLKPLF